MRVHSSVVAALLISFNAAVANGTAPPISNRAPAPRAAMSEPALSPDRREIAFVSGGDIWTVPASGGEAASARIASRLRLATTLFTRRDTARFLSTRTGNGDVYVVTLATGALQRITFDDVAEQLDAWSRDGKWLYFSSGSKTSAG